MSKNTKTLKNQSERLATFSAQAGLLLMSAATTFGMIELPDHMRGQITVPTRAVFTFSTTNTDQNNPLRRERDESMPHYISYGVTQRTPARSGRR